MRIDPFIAKIWLFFELDLHFDEHSEKHPPCYEMGCTKKKLIPQFVCTYYPGSLPKVYSTILSIQIQDSPPVERKQVFGVPAPGLVTTGQMTNGDSKYQA